jgi:hypothetical protein
MDRVFKGRQLRGNAREETTQPVTAFSSRARWTRDPGGRVSTMGGANARVLVLARLSLWANVERAQGGAAEAA